MSAIEEQTSIEEGYTWRLFVLFQFNIKRRKEPYIEVFHFKETENSDGCREQAMRDARLWHKDGHPVMLMHYTWPPKFENPVKKTWQMVTDAPPFWNEHIVKLAISKNVKIVLPLTLS